MTGVPPCGAAAGALDSGAKHFRREAPAMLEQIRSFFRASMLPKDGPEREGAPEDDIRLAACALLLELAYADEEFSEGERRHLESAISRQFGVDRTEAEELIQLAERERRTATDMWQFTRLIKESYSLGQKVVLAEIMWGLVFSDGQLATREDYLMRKICALLDLKPGYLSEARKRAGGGATMGATDT